MTTETLVPALIRTKLHRPPLPTDWVPRPQLLSRLDQQRERPITLVSAPAGFGKTTLLSAWLERCAWRSAWLSLDDDDDQLATFLACTIAALQTLFPEFGAATGALLSAVPLPPVPVLVRCLINELDELDEPFVLVLDDYHVIHTAAIHDLWAKLLSHPPRALHLVLAVRHDPPLPIDTLRARAAIGEIRSQDLRFSVEETQAFLQRALEIPIDETQAALLQAKIEGWAAGLRLVALSSWPQTGAAKLTRFSSSDMPLMDYLAGEVLARQPAVLQEVLL
jgi:LuxR family maltose regulon positive regulatory protein